MEDDPKNEEQDPKEPEEGAEEGKGAEDPKPSDPKEPEEGLTDKHGQDAIAKGRYDRDMKAKDDEIADLKKQIAESSKTEQGRADLEQKIEALEGKQSEMKADYELKLAGCTDDKKFKAAKKLLGDYENDVPKLKADYPYLFAEEKKKGSTGLKPEGPVGGDIDDKLDRAFGLKK